MGWVWREESEGKTGNKSNKIRREEEEEEEEKRGYSTRKIVKTECRTEEVEPGKFLYKCQKTEQTLRDFLGRPTEVIESNKEYTEEDVSDQMKSGSYSMNLPEMGPFDFPGLRGDIESIERNILGGLGRLFEAAEEMTNGFFGATGSSRVFDGDSLSTSSPRRGIPIKDFPHKEAPEKKPEKSGEFDISGLAKDV